MGNTPLTFAGESADLGNIAGRLTSVSGSSFCISDRSGNIHPGYPHGLFYGDVRFLSQLEVLVDGRSPEALSSTAADHSSAEMVAEAAIGNDPDCRVLVFRRRLVGRGMREDVVIRNFEDRTVTCALDVRLNADFASIFDVKEEREVDSRCERVNVSGRSLRFSDAAGRSSTTVTFDRPIDGADDNDVRLCADIPPRGAWSTRMDITLALDGNVQPTYRTDDAAQDTEDTDRWHRAVPVLRTPEPRLAHAFQASVRDLAALRVSLRDDAPIVAAGAPWFMTLFGRDSLLTAWMALLVDPQLAVATLDALAGLQGRARDQQSEEQPGRILHEIRVGAPSAMAPGGRGVYYGTADATPLFVMLVGELHRWGTAPDAVARLLPHVDRALEWVTQEGDEDADGYIEYQRQTDSGLANQGWKDSWDGISFADGTIPRPPIALCEVQAYVYGAFRARAELARTFESDQVAGRWRRRAASLRDAYERDFWLADRGWYAVGLDADKRRIDSLASNMGHGLWTGIVRPDRADAVVSRLMSDELFSGWGIRTLAESMQRFHPLSYHNGSVWPHDNAIIAAGLAAYGFDAPLQRLAEGLLAASSSYGGHLPELFGGISRSDFRAPVDYTATSSPQAWAAATPLLLLRSLLGLDPRVPDGRVLLRPALPPWLPSIELDGVPLAGTHVTIRADAAGSFDIAGLPAGVSLERKGD